MDHKERAADNLELVGGRLCLDFANTLSTRSHSPRRDYLASYADLVAWSLHAGILQPTEAGWLLDHAGRRPESAGAALEQAIALRETLYRIFAALAAGQEPQAADLAALNRALHHALSHLQVLSSPYGFAWGWTVSADDLERMVWPIARSAADLLTSAERSQVRRCARPGCDWLFVDSSKNHSRRWCSMTMCGSRAKMQRYYRRRKQGINDD